MLPRLAPCHTNYRSLEKIEGASQHVWAAREVVMTQVDPMATPREPEPFCLLGNLLCERLDDGGHAVAELQELTRARGYLDTVAQELEIHKQSRACLLYTSRCV